MSACSTAGATQRGFVQLQALDEASGRADPARGRDRPHATRETSMTEPSRPTLAFHPLTPERWGDLEVLFGPERGAVSGCWCMWFRLTRGAWRELGRTGRKQAFHQIVEEGPVPGILAYADGRAVGWCAVAPRSEHPSLERSKVSRRIDDAPVWTITCFYIDRHWRRQGLMRRLIEAACGHAAGGGAGIVEAYPKVARVGQGAGDLYVGTLDAFTACGFEVVAAPTPVRRVVRRRLVPAVTR
jgi:GNAT superfamily N-acetyltransferase